MRGAHRRSRRSTFADVLRRRSLPRRLLTATTAAALVVSGTVAASASTGDHEASPAVASGLTLQRWAGSDRYATAEALAGAAFPGGATTVVLASGENFPDGLVASYLAGAVHAPVLLTATEDLPAPTRDALLALHAASVDVVGGPAAVSDQVLGTLRGLGLQVTRVSGADRYGTAAAVATAQAGGSPQPVAGVATAFLASGATFADALPAGAVADRSRIPLLLSTPAALPAATANALQKLAIRHVVVLGGSGAISTAVDAQLAALGITEERVAGATRTATAAALASWAQARLDLSASGIAIARGDNAGGGADALSLAPLAAARNEPILLTASPTTPSDDLLGYATHPAGQSSTVTLTHGDIAGGTAAVAPALATAVEQAAANVTPTPPGGGGGTDGNSVVPKADTEVATAAQVSSVTGAPGGTQTTVLAAGAPVPRVGGHLVAPQTGQAPDGLLGTVTQVQADPDGTTTVTTAPATLDEAYSTFTVSAHESLATPNTAQLRPAAGLNEPRIAGPAAKSKLPFSLNLTAAEFDCKGSGAGPTITVDADLTNTDIDFRFSLYGTPGPAMDLSFNSQPIFTLDVGFTGQLTCTLKGGAVLAVRIPVSASPPLEILLEPAFTVTAAGTVSVKFSWTPRLVTGFFAMGTHVDRNLYFKSSGDVGIGGSAGLEFFFGVHAELSLAGAVGVSGEFGPNLDVSLSHYSGQACQDVDSAMKVDLSADASVFVKHWTFVLFSVTWGHKTLYNKCVSDHAPTIITTDLPHATADSPYTETLDALGGTAPYTWSISSGTLPPGLSLDPATGTISGTPTTPGNPSFTVQVSDANGATATAPLTITVDPAPLVITTDSLPEGQVAKSYDATLDAAGGTRPYTWTLASGSLPVGLQLGSDGSITGTPTAASDSFFSAQVTDDRGMTATTAELELTIGSESAGLSWEAPVSLGVSTSGGESPAVSCPSTMFCVAANSDGWVRMFNGTAWSSPQLIESNGYRLVSVSCASAVFCVALDQGGEHNADGGAVTFDGTSWSPRQEIDGNGYGLRAVSCSSAEFCVAVDGGGGVVTFNGTTWSQRQQIDIDGYSLVGVSCPSADFCLALDLTTLPNTPGGMLTFNGTAWSPRQPIADFGYVGYGYNPVSCSSAIFCTTVNGESALTFNGSTWSPAQQVDPGEWMLSVSCPTESFCIAVDDRGDALTFNGSIWSAPAQIDPMKHILTAVSCPSESFCAAAGTTPSNNGYTSAIALVGRGR